MNQMNRGICVGEDIVKIVCLVKFRVHLGSHGEKSEQTEKKRASIWVSRRHEFQAYFLLHLSVPEYKKKLGGK